jgi:hypothetical protein
MIKFEKKFLYTFADVEEAKKLIGKKGIFSDVPIDDYDLKNDNLCVLEDAGYGEYPFKLDRCFYRYRYFYHDPNLECKRAYSLEGKEIQWRSDGFDWTDCKGEPCWSSDNEYRIKPVPVPEETRLTNREVAEWLAKGNGQVLLDDLIDVCFMYSPREENDICDFQIRKWSDDDWHLPTKEYIEDNKE